MSIRQLGYRIHDIFTEHEAGFSGACLVTRNGEALFSAARGLANREHGVPNTLDTLFETASVTKVFTAIAVLQLIETGKLQLEDRITEVLDLSGTRIPPEVTVEQLLNHTSGIADDADEESGEDFSALFTDLPCYAVRTCADFLPLFAHKEPMFKAGEGVRYNNCAFILLGLAVERLTGESYQDYVSREVFRRCGLAHSRFCHKDEVNPGIAEGYFAEKDAAGNFLRWKKNIYSHPPVGTADGGAFTSVSELDSLMLGLRQGRLLSPAYTELLLQPHCVHTRPHRHGTWRTGYAFEFIEHNVHSEHNVLAGETFCMYKEGGDVGVDAILAYFPRLGVTLSMLSNQDGPLWDIYRGMQAALFDLHVTS